MQLALHWERAILTSGGSLTQIERLFFFLQGFKRVSARGSEWPISRSVIVSTPAAESVKLDMIIFSRSRSRGD